MAKATNRRAEASWIESRNRWQINVQRDGIRRTFTNSVQGRKGKHDAEGKADDWLEKGTKEMCFKAAWDEFLEYQKSHSGTSNYNQYEYIGRLYISPCIGNAKLNRITPIMWQKCLDTAEEKGLARRTIKNVRTAISAFLTYSRRARWEVHTIERGDLIISKTAPRAERNILQPDALRKLFSVETITHWGKEKQVFFIHAWRFLVLTGLRRGELCGLRNEDIVDGVIHIHRSVNAQGEITRGKNDNADRRIFLSAGANAELEQQQSMLKKMGLISPWTFPDEHGGMLDSNHLYNIWTTYRDQHELKCSLHELRHTFISIVKNEMPEPLLKMVVGHSDDMDTYGVYGHEVTDEMQKAAKIADTVFAKILHQ